MKTIKSTDKARALSTTKAKASSPIRARAVGTHADTIKALKARPGVAAELRRLEPELVLLDGMLKARNKQQLTQSDVAERMHTTKSAVSRLEGALLNKTHSPSIATVQRYAQALGYELKLSLVQVR